MAILFLIVAAVAAVLGVFLFLMPGWKSSLLLYAAYVVVFYLVTRTPDFGPCDGIAECNGRAAGNLIQGVIVGMGWFALIAVGIVRGVSFLNYRPTQSR